MRAYPSIFRVESSRRPAPQSRSHSCDAAVRKLGESHVQTTVRAIHDRCVRVCVCVCGWGWVGGVLLEQEWTAT